MTGGGAPRQAARNAFETQVRLSLPDRPPVTFLSHDLSTSGLFLRTQRPLPKGTRVGLAFQLPGGGRFSCLAEVAWTSASQPGPHGRSGMGLRFTPLSPEELLPLSRCLDTSGDHRGVLILEDDDDLREALATSFWARRLPVTTARWDCAKRALDGSHVLWVLGVDRAGLAAQWLPHRAKARRIALLGYPGAGAEWHPHALYCFNKPVDPDQVARLSLALFR
jgi:uncharacterized protein (TIGR02266 family)